MEDEVGDLRGAEEKILDALRNGETLSAMDIAARFEVSRSSVKVLIANIRKRRLAPGEYIPKSKTGAGITGEYHLERV